MKSSFKRTKTKVQDLIDILKYLSLNFKVEIPIEKFGQKDNLGDVYRKFQICLIKYLQNKAQGSQEHENAMQLFKIFTRVLNSFADSGDAPANEQVEAEWEELMTRKNLSRSSRTRETPDSLEFAQKYALVQKGAEGNFFFTSAVSKNFDDYNVDTSAAKVKIEPSRGIRKDRVAKLGSVAGSSVVNSQARKIRKGFKIYAAEFPEYGAFHSFAPSVDLGRANLSRIDSIAVRYPGRKVFIDKTLQSAEYPVKIYKGGMDSTLPQMVSLPTDEELDNLSKAPSEETSSEVDLSLTNIGFLKEMGVELDHLLETDEEGMDIDEMNDSTLIVRNVGLIKKLIDFQDERFRKSSADVSLSELQVAITLKSNLAKIVSAFAPKDLVSVDQVREAMKYVKKTEKAFRGGLSQQAPFVFPCNSAGNGLIPPGSGTVPLALLRDSRKTD